MTTEAWIYRFGDVEVEPAAHRITRDGADLGVEPKAFGVLTMLLEQPGRALERDELLDRVWGHRHVTPGVLNRVVAQLRKALGDDAEHPRYIQTLHSLGYRFIADVQRVPVISMEQAAEVAKIETDATTAATIAPDTQQQSHVPISKRTLWLALAAAVVVALGVFARMQQQQQQRARPAASIAVLPFTSLSSSRDDSYFAEGLAVEMHDALAAVQGLKVAAQMSPSAASRGADAKSLGERLGVATVLDASVRRNGPRIRISARLSDTSSGYTLWSQTYDRHISDIFATQSEIANEVVQSLLGVLPGRREALAKRLTPTKNIAAFDAYLKGLQRLLRSDGDGNRDNAIVFFNQALAADSGFARAQAGICRSEVARFVNLRDAGAYERARATCQRAQEMDAGSSEVNLALAELHHARGDLGKAIKHYTKAQADPAREPAVYVGMAIVSADQGRQDRALDYFKRALELRPGDASIHAQIGYHHYLAGDLPKAITAYRKATELQPEDADLWSYLGGVYITAGNNADASRVLARSIAIKPGSAALNNLGDLKYQAGEYAEAASLYRRATVLDPTNFFYWGGLGDALLAEAGSTAQAKDAFREAATQAHRYVEIKPSDATSLAALGWYSANLQQASRAREMVGRSEALASESAEVDLFNAQTLALLGDIDQARRRVAAARAAGMAENRITTNAVLRRVQVIYPVAESHRTGSPALSDREGRPPGE